ncbi:hypothetical protein VFPPC_15957 [Pochonia chlamydosporia 170]|uniref:Uncharacterized protein n=1 Tax=Pochonia chlamydosporia 170 TaxID=1380566 RepID=A0A179FJP5_METCM|nr:hypothetical protein VFPPC_15957 [Pochonia chlamydosporia 170]OAQ65855.1 hypothetical protein VFPPC_15957 [Pochonia chlamydosporia 170]
MATAGRGKDMMQTSNCHEALLVLLKRYPGQDNNVVHSELPMKALVPHNGLYLKGTSTTILEAAEGDDVVEYGFASWAVARKKEDKLWEVGERWLG